MSALSRVRVLRFQVAWMLAVAVVLALFDAASVPLFLSASLVGLIVLAEMATPRYASPSWVVRLRRLVVVGVLAFALYVAVRMVRLLPPDAL